MKRTTDEMIFLLSEYASRHPNTIQTFDDLTPYIAMHPEIFGGQDEEDSPSYKAFVEGESTTDEETARKCFEKSLELEPLNFDAKGELIAVTSKDVNEYETRCLDEQTKGLTFFLNDPNYKSKIGHFFDETITASFLRFTKSLMEQFYNSGRYDVAISLGRELLYLDVEDNYKARHIFFKALVGLGLEKQTEEFLRTYHYEKDAYYYGTLALRYINRGEDDTAFEIIRGELKEANMYIADCLLYGNDYELKNEAEKRIETFLDQIPYAGGTREALNYVDEALPFDGKVLQDFQDKYLANLLESQKLDYEDTILIVTLAELSLIKKVVTVSMPTLKSILEGDNEPYKDLSMYGELRESSLLEEELNKLSTIGLVTKEGEDYLLTHDGYSSFMALCRMSAKKAAAKA